MLAAAKKIGLIPPDRIQALPRMETAFPEKMNGETLVACLRIREDGLNIVRKGNKAYYLWKKNSFYTKRIGPYMTTLCLPVLAAVQSYIIENYSSKDVDILQINWGQTLNYIHLNLDDGVALWGDEYEPDFEAWEQVFVGKK